MTDQELRDKLASDFKNMSAAFTQVTLERDQLRAEIERLEKLMSSLVVQVGHGDGYYSFHKAIIWPDGHIGHNGPIVHIGEQIEQQALAEYREKFPKENPK